jgi:hypothetical protein
VNVPLADCAAERVAVGVSSPDTDALGDWSALRETDGVAAAEPLPLGDCAPLPEALGDCTGDAVLLAVCAADCVPLTDSAADGDPLGAVDCVTEGDCAAECVPDAVSAADGVPLTVAAVEPLTLAVAAADGLPLGDWAAEPDAVGVSGAEREGLGDCSADGVMEGVCSALQEGDGVCSGVPLPLTLPVPVSVPVPVADTDGDCEPDALEVADSDALVVTDAEGETLALSDGDCVAAADGGVDGDTVAAIVGDCDTVPVAVSLADAGMEGVPDAELPKLAVGESVAEPVMLTVVDPLVDPLAVVDPLAELVGVGLPVRDPVTDGVNPVDGETVGSDASQLASHRTARTCEWTGRGRGGRVPQLCMARRSSRSRLGAKTVLLAMQQILPPPLLPSSASHPVGGVVGDPYVHPAGHVVLRRQQTQRPGKAGGQRTAAVAAEGARAAARKRADDPRGQADPADATAGVLQQQRVVARHRQLVGLVQRRCQAIAAVARTGSTARPGPRGDDAGRHVHSAHPHAGPVTNEHRVTVHRHRLRLLKARVDG